MSCQRDARAILRELAECVLASEEPYPTQGEILFDDLEGIVAPSHHMSHSFYQVSVHIATLHFPANFRLTTLSADWSRKEAAQNEWPRFWNLFEKHQCFPYCVARREEILASCNGSEMFSSARGFNFSRYFPAFLWVQRILLHTLQLL